MKLKPFLLTFISLCRSLASAVPLDEAQVVFNQSPVKDAFGIGDIKHSVLDYIEDSKKVILKGKKNMQKWIHAGKEYIKQDNLLCETISYFVPAMELNDTP